MGILVEGPLDLGAMHLRRRIQSPKMLANSKSQLGLKTMQLVAKFKAMQLEKVKKAQ